MTRSISRHRPRDSRQAGFAIHAVAAVVEARDEETIVLSLSDIDLDVPRPLREAAKAALDAGRAHYAPPADPSGSNAVNAQRRRRAHGLEHRANDVMVYRRAQSALIAAVLTATDPGDDSARTALRYRSACCGFGRREARHRAVPEIRKRPACGHPYLLARQTDRPHAECRVGSRHRRSAQSLDCLRRSLPLPLTRRGGAQTGARPRHCGTVTRGKSG